MQSTATIHHFLMDHCVYVFVCRENMERSNDGSMRQTNTRKIIFVKNVKKNAYVLRFQFLLSCCTVQHFFATISLSMAYNCFLCWFFFLHKFVIPFRQTNCKSIERRRKKKRYVHKGYFLRSSLSMLFCREYRRFDKQTKMARKH